MRIKFSLAFVIATLLTCAACVQMRQQAPSSMIKNPEVIDSDEVFVINSATVGQDYRIRVRTPSGYAANPEMQYPLVIKIDGQWDFPLVTGAYNCLYFDGQMPQTIFVGIDWNVGDDKVQQLRARDLLPSPIKSNNESGRAKRYVDVLVSEILPALNGRYRLNGQEFLVGGSWGGLFVTYALLERPDIFDGAISIGGSYDSGAEVLKQQISNLKLLSSLKGNRLYLGTGKMDPAAKGAVRYFEALSAANIPGLKVRFDYLDGFGHSGMNIPGYASGFQYLFERPKIEVESRVLRSLAGRYQPVGGGDELVLQVGSNSLQVVVAGEVFNLFANSANSFYHPGVYFNLGFNGDSLNVETFFGKTQYKRVNASK